MQIFREKKLYFPEIYFRDSISSLEILNYFIWTFWGVLGCFGMKKNNCL